jgi:hypothetical protein
MTGRLIESNMENPVSTGVAHTSSSPVRRACCQPFSIVVQLRIVLKEYTNQFHSKASRKCQTSRLRWASGVWGMHFMAEMIFFIRANVQQRTSWRYVCQRQKDGQDLAKCGSSVLSRRWRGHHNHRGAWFLESNA